MGRRASHPAGVPFPRLAPDLYCCLHSEFTLLGSALRPLPHGPVDLSSLTSRFNKPTPWDPSALTGIQHFFSASRLCLVLSLRPGCPFPVFYPSDLLCLQGSGLMSLPRKVMALFLSPAALHIARLWPFLWPCRLYFTGLGICFSKTLGKATLSSLCPGQRLAGHLTQGRCSVRCVERREQEMWGACSPRAPGHWAMTIS